MRVQQMLLVAVPLLGVTDEPTRPVPMQDVTIRGAASAATREIRLVLQAGIGTPFGRIPINGHMRLHYDCSSQFTATVSYNSIVRLLARIKGVDLITVVDGRVQQDGAQECPVMEVTQIVGRAAVETTQLSGFLRLDGDSLDFRGPAWMVGDTSYHSILQSKRGERRLELHVNMYER